MCPLSHLYLLNLRSFVFLASLFGISSDEIGMGDKNKQTLTFEVNRPGCLKLRYLSEGKSSLNIAVRFPSSAAALRAQNSPVTTTLAPDDTLWNPVDSLKSGENLDSRVVHRADGISLFLCKNPYHFL